MISDINLTGPSFRPCSLRISAKGCAIDAQELNALKPVAGAMARMLELRSEAIEKWLRGELEKLIDGADAMTAEQLADVAKASGFEMRCVVPPNAEPGCEYFVVLHAGQIVGSGFQLAHGVANPGA